VRTGRIDAIGGKYGTIGGELRATIGGGNAPFHVAARPLSLLAV
jgi:hypothetical protein